MTQIIFIALFFLIIIVLVVLAAVGSFREKQSKKANDLEKQIIYHETKNDRFEVLIRLGLYFQNLEKYLENYDPLKGVVSLGQVNNFGANLIISIKKSDQINRVYRDEIRKEEIKEHIDLLNNVKPSN